MELTRRNFVKTTAVVLASAAAAGTMGGCSSSLAGTGDDAAATGGDTTKTVGVCRFCGCGCGVIVEAKDGKVISVTGDPENGSSRGLNCVKGYYLAGALYGEDRLTRPLIRDDASTKGTPDGLREATWEEALDLVAGKLRDTWKAGAAASSPSWRVTAPPSSGRRGCSPTTSTPTRACAWPAPWWAS